MAKCDQGTHEMTSQELVNAVGLLTRAISGDAGATVRALPAAGGEQTLVLDARGGTGRLLGKGGGTFRALRRVVSAAAWRTGVAFRLVISDPRERIEESKDAERCATTG